MITHVDQKDLFNRALKLVLIYYEEKSAELDKTNKKKHDTMAT